MKKRKRTMLILLVMLAALAVGYFVVEKIQTDQQTKKESEVVEDTIYLTELSDVTAFQYSDGTETLSFVKKDVAWLYEGDEELDLEESELESIAAALGTVEALRVLDEPDALADYGLEEPLYTVEVQDGSGVITTYSIGNATDSGYYAVTGEKEVVYIISSSVVSAMEWDVDELVYVAETEETEE